MTWTTLRSAMVTEPLPAAVVDLDAFDANVDLFVSACAAGQKKLRLATKSIRCLSLIRRICERAGETLSGLMTYTAEETAFLASQGFRDLLLAYPTVHPADLGALARANAAGAVAAVVVDDLEQLGPLATAARAAVTTIPVVIEIDLAYRPLGALHLGVRRSPLRDAKAIVDLAARAADMKGLRFHGVMGYEAHVAGMGDVSAAIIAFKRLASPVVARTRAAVVDALGQCGLIPTVVNGGGTGTLLRIISEPSLTEVTAGSAFLAGHLFDHYRGLSLRPALAFALQVVRRPGPGFVTCHGGGWIASGEPGADRLPTPVFPEGLALLPREGAGEVQTPLSVPHGMEIRLGDAILFRPAKSGEIAEHFKEYLLVRESKISERALTYRGLGHVFLG